MNPDGRVEANMLDCTTGACLLCSADKSWAALAKGTGRDPRHR
jgi:hypothetical protein